MEKREVGKQGFEEPLKSKEGILAGKYALVSGGAKGIGKAIVKEFLLEGAKVVFLDKDQEAVSFLMEELQGYDVEGLAVDISDKEKLDKIFAVKKLEEVDILVNNAGVDRNYSLSNPDGAIWNEIFNTNLNGARILTEKVINGMKKRKSGSIIFITSGHTAQAFKGGAAYDSSKHALVGLARSIALEYGEYGIRSNAIAPGAIYHAGVTGRLSEKEALELGERIPLKRAGEPEDVAMVVAFVASDKAGYISGEEIRVDGGLAIKNALQ